MKKIILVFFVLITTTFKSYAQDGLYVGIGYNFAYSRLHGFNNWVNAYNSNPSKNSGTITVTDSMTNMHLLTGFHMAVGYDINSEKSIEFRYTNRVGHSYSNEFVSTSGSTFKNDIRYTAPSFGLTYYKVKEDKNVGIGYALDMVFGKLDFRYKVVGTSKYSQYFDGIPKFKNLAFTPFIQINTYPLGRDGMLRLSFRPYYQMNLKRRDFSPWNEKIKNVNDPETKLKTTCSNIGVEVQLAVYPFKVKIPKKEKVFVYEEPKEPVTNKTEPVIDEVSSGFIIKGKVLDKATKAPVSGASVTITDPKTGKVIGTTTSGTDGSYKLSLQEGSDFSITAQSKGYLTNHEEAQLEAEASSVEKDVLLEPITVGTSVNLKNVLFERGTSVLIADSYPELDRLVTFMNENPTVTIELGGHTSNEGDPKVNTKLSEDRVKVVKEYLVKKGISAGRIEVKAYGPTKPLYPNDSEEHRKLNRRVEFTILKK